ncbi:hypothetical protein KY289_027002 [Solanum tuberosum]|nr:hypothetical protein KY289_027002 [Solanum tuberosum]
MALNKEYGSMDTGVLIRPCYTNSNYVDTDNPLKTRRFYEAILTDTYSIEIKHSRDINNPDHINYSRWTIKKILDPLEWFVDNLYTPIALTMTNRPQTYNWYDYKSTWMNFLYLRPRHTWFVKYSPSITKATIPQWFYNWWNLFGGIEIILAQQFLRIFKPKKKLLPCRSISNFKGWVPQQPNVKVQSKDQASSSSKSSSKAALKEKLKDALDNLEKYDGKQIMKMIEDAASTESSSEDNSDICNPKGLALAYMDPDYE